MGNIHSNISYELQRKAIRHKGKLCITKKVSAQTSYFVSKESSKFFIYNVFTKSTEKIHCRYEAPREEPREAHGCLATGLKGYLVASSVYVGKRLHCESV